MTGYVPCVRFLSGEARRAVRSARPATLAERIERAPALDGPVSALSAAVVRALPPGRRADALHGVPFGQPAHPALVRIPVGCWTSAVLLDLCGGRGAERAAATLVAAGLAAAVPAVATGLADWSALHRHQQRVGLVHAAAQASATMLFAGSLLARVAGHRGKAKMLSAGGLMATTAGAYLGGHLALRLGAGASHAEPIGHLAELGWSDLCPLAELPEGRPVRRQLGYLSLLTVRAGTEVRVLSDHCAHLGGPLHQGRLTSVDGATCVVCPWHGSTFRLSDGAVMHGPATARQPAFDTQVSDSGMVQVRAVAGPKAAKGHAGQSRRLARVPRGFGTGGRS